MSSYQAYTPRPWQQRSIHNQAYQPVDGAEIELGQTNTPYESSETLVKTPAVEWHEPEEKEPPEPASEREIPQSLPNKHGGLTGWRSGVLISACIASVTCLINTGIAVWLTIAFHPIDGIGTVYDGTTEQVNNTSLGVHLAINILSTALLAASNYTMQSLAAPTRSECDVVHARKGHLDIGINSVRNLASISRWRMLLWLLLGLSSLPIHLIYNSVVFKVLATNEYRVLIANPAYISNSSILAELAYSGTPNPPNCTMWAPGNGYLDLDRGNFSIFTNIATNCTFEDCPLTASSDPEKSAAKPNLKYIIDTCVNETCSIDYKKGNGTHVVAVVDSLVDPTSQLWNDCHFSDCILTDIANNENDHASMSDVWSACTTVPQDSMSKDFEYIPDYSFWQAQYHSNNNYVKLSLTDCLRTYGQSYVSDWNDVIFVTKADVAQPTVYRFYNSSAWFQDASHGTTSVRQLSSHDWLCDDHAFGTSCDTNALIAKGDQYQLAGQAIDYCMAEKSSANSKIQFSLPLLIIVIVCNLIKAICMFAAILVQRERPLVVVGDAVASYLDRPDLSTKDLCLNTITDAETLSWVDAEATVLKSSQRWPLSKAIGGGHFFATVVLIGMFIITSTVLFGNAMETVKLAYQGTQTIGSLGFGQVQSQMVMSPMQKNAFAVAVIVSNLPQLVLSFSYVMYNGCLTVMMLAKETVSYANKPHTLRVSYPSGAQRSSFFLQLPYFFGIPLLASSVTLHWIISEAFFLLSVDAYFEGSYDEVGSLTTMAYSPLAILIALIVGVCMLIAATIFGCQRVGGMHAVSSNSFAIAASCHPPSTDIDAAGREVQWGEPEEYWNYAVGHCTFTSQTVRKPVVGRPYR